MSLGKPGHRPVVSRLMASTRDSCTLKPSASSSTFSFIRCEHGGDRLHVHGAHAAHLDGRRR